MMMGLKTFHFPTKSGEGALHLIIPSLYTLWWDSEPDGSARFGIAQGSVEFYHYVQVVSIKLGNLACCIT